MRRLAFVAMTIVAFLALGSTASAATLASEASFRATLNGDVSGGSTLLLTRDGGGSLSVKAYNVNPGSTATVGLAIGTCDTVGPSLISFTSGAASDAAVAVGWLRFSASQVAAVRRALGVNRPLSVRVLTAGATGCGEFAGHPAVGTGRLHGGVPGVSGASYDIRYPVVSGIGDDAAGIVNARLAQDATATVAGFASDARDAGQTIAGSGPSTATQTFTVSLSRPTILSLGELFIEFRTGAAHPFANLSTYTFDLTTGQLLKLSDILRPGYLSILSSESRTRLRALLGGSSTTSVINSGTTPSAANFTGWQIEASGLRITFGEFQVGPHSVGLPSIVIPWSSLRSVINFNSPIAGLVPPGACTASQLIAQMSIWEGGVGSRFNTLRVTNRSRATCFLQGNPEPQLIDGAGHIVLQGGPATTAGAKVVLAPAAGATISVVTNDYCGPRPTNPLRVVLRLPASGGRVVGIPSPEGSTADDLPPCNGPVGTNVMDIIVGWHHA